jgi:hypothetical protein
MSHPAVVTAWLAFTLGNGAPGSMRVIPRSHLHDPIPHRDTFAPVNLLSRGDSATLVRGVDRRGYVEPRAAAAGRSRSGRRGLPPPRDRRDQPGFVSGPRPAESPVDDAAVRVVSAPRVRGPIIASSRAHPTVHS